MSERNRIRQAVRFWALVCLLILSLAETALAAGDKHREIVFALDDSGSMRTTDRRALSKKAAEIFVRLMDREDRLGVIAFSDGARTIQSMTRMQGDRRKRAIMKSISRLKRKGKLTDIETALQRALKQYTNLPDTDRALLLLTDGRIDLDNRRSDSTEAEAASRKRILETLIPSFRKHGIPIYAMAFGGNTDEELLRKMASDSRGLYFEIGTAKEIAGIYFKIFNQIKAPQLAPVSGGKFSLDQAVREATLLIQSSTRKNQLELFSPKGKKYTRSKSSRKIRWGGNEAFTMITISNPKPGRWTIGGIPDSETKVILLTDIQMECPVMVNRFRQNEPIYVLARIEAGAANPDLEIPVYFKAELVSEAGNIVDTANLLDDGDPGGQCGEDRVDRWRGGYSAGIFGGNDRLFDPGIYTVRVKAESETFQRQRQYAITIRRGGWAELPAEEVTIDKGKPLYLVWRVTLPQVASGFSGAGAIVDPERPFQLDVLGPDGSNKKLTITRQEEGSYQAVFPGEALEGDYRLELRQNMAEESPVCVQTAATLTQKVSYRLPPEAMVPAEIKKRGFGLLEGILLGVMILFLGTSIFMLLKLKRMSKAVTVHRTQQAQVLQAQVEQVAQSQQAEKRAEEESGAPADGIDADMADIDAAVDGMEMFAGTDEEDAAEEKTEPEKASGEEEEKPEPEAKEKEPAEKSEEKPAEAEKEVEETEPEPEPEPEPSMDVETPPDESETEVASEPEEEEAKETEPESGPDRNLGLDARLGDIDAIIDRMEAINAGAQTFKEALSEDEAKKKEASSESEEEIVEEIPSETMQSGPLDMSQIDSLIDNLKEDDRKEPEEQQRPKEGFNLDHLDDVIAQMQSFSATPTKSEKASEGQDSPNAEEPVKTETPFSMDAVDSMLDKLADTKDSSETKSEPKPEPKEKKPLDMSEIDAAIARMGEIAGKPEPKKEPPKPEPKEKKPLDMSEIDAAIARMGEIAGKPERKKEPPEPKPESEEKKPLNLDDIDSLIAQMSGGNNDGGDDKPETPQPEMEPKEKSTMSMNDIDAMIAQMSSGGGEEATSTRNSGEAEPESDSKSPMSMNDIDAMIAQMSSGGGEEAADTRSSGEAEPDSDSESPMSMNDIDAMIARMSSGGGGESPEASPASDAKQETGGVNLSEVDEMIARLDDPAPSDPVPEEADSDSEDKSLSDTTNFDEAIRRMEEIAARVPNWKSKGKAVGAAAKR